MVTLNELQEKITELISVYRSSKKVSQVRSNSLLEIFLELTADQAFMAEQKSSVADDLTEELIRVVALAAMTEVNLQKQVEEALLLLESLSCEAS